MAWDSAPIASASAALGSIDLGDITGATLIVVQVASYLTLATAVGPDSAGNTYTARTGYGANAQSQVWDCINPVISTTLTIPITGNDEAACAQAWGGEANPAYDSSNGADSSGSGTQATGSLTASGSGSALLIAGASFGGSNVESVASIDSGFTLDGSEPLNPGVTMGAGMAYLVQASPAAVDPTFTLTAGDGAFTATIQSYIAASSGGSSLSASGTSTASWGGASTGQASIAAAGSSAVAFVGESQAQVSLAATGASSASFIPNNGAALSASGSSSVSFTGAADVFAALSATGDATASFAGSHSNGSLLSASGDSASAWTAQAHTLASLSAIGTSAVQWVGTSEIIVSAIGALSLSDAARYAAALSDASITLAALKDKAIGQAGLSDV